MNAIIATFHCTLVDKNTWNSPPKAPFGGIVIEKRCEGRELEFFLNCIKEWLSADGPGKLLVTAAPACYHQVHHDLLHRSYINTGFLPIRTLTNHFIFSEGSNFCDVIKSSEKRRLRKAIEKGFESFQDRTISPQSAVEFLLQCYHKNGYRLSMTSSQLQNLLSRFPDHFITFSVADKGQLIGLAVAVRVSSNILYYFTSGFLSDYKSFSPIVLLMEQIYGFCQQNKITILDLGTSLDHEGKYKPTLAKFKENIGGKTCQKITYALTF